MHFEEKPGYIISYFKSQKILWHYKQHVIHTFHDVTM